MSFFIEDGKNATTLFFAGSGTPSVYQKKLSLELGGTFYSKMKSERGYYPAWIFDRTRRLHVEEFMDEMDDSESIKSYPDLEPIVEELCRRLERAELEINKLKKLIYKS